MLVAYVLWGLFPVFWKQLKAVDATELIAHRIVWSLVFVLGVTALIGGWAELRRGFGSPRLLGLHVASGLFVTANWLIFVWGVNNGYIIETSLGYYLVPLVNVTLGRLFLGERLRPLQQLAILIAAVGVGLQLFAQVHIPWVALGIAATWAFYGLLRKRSPLGSLAGLTLETALLGPIAGAFLLWRFHLGTGALGRVPAWETLLILSAGAVTAVPLLLFTFGVRRLRMSTVGLLQYIVPTMTFALGTLLYHEPLDRARFVSFGFIWVALILYSLDTYRGRNTGPAA